MAREIIGFCDFGLADLFLMALSFHEFVALVSKLDAREGVDGVIDAAMIGIEAAEKAAIGGIDNGIAFERRYVPFPKIDSFLDWR